MSVVGSVARKVFVSRKIEEILEQIPKEVGTFGNDPWGFDKESSKLGFALLKILYDNYFRVKAHGLENVPASGRVLVVANHSGQLPFDGTLIGVAMATNPMGPRAPRAMIERFFPTVPFIGNWLNEVGAVIGDPVNCIRMLEREEAVIVFPEGVRGSGKLYRKRYQLQRFGNGFMHIAMQYNTPIVPVGVVGCEETMPSLANIAPLARLLGLPYVPLAIPMPLPARVELNFGEPMHFSGDVNDEESVTRRVEQVKDVIRSLINKGLSERKGIF
ncbi:MAG: lysophospholipid acyltransferase family protein [Desulfatibacillaceae bacterium]